MTDQFSWSEAAKEIGDPFGTLAWLVAGFVPPGPARTAVLVIEGLCVFAAPFIYKYYLGVLAQGAQPEGSLERKDYDALRASLAGGNLAEWLYAKWLTAFLDWVERFFGDAGVADRTLFPHAFGLSTPAPLWTAPAFDRCLLLAMIYPVATIFVIWAISGHVGPAEAALGLAPNVQGWLRGAAAGAIAVSSFAVWRAHLLPARKRAAWLIVSVAGANAGLFAFIFSRAGAAAGAAACTFAGAAAGAIAFVFAGTFAFAGAAVVVFAGAVFGAIYHPPDSDAASGAAFASAGAAVAVAGVAAVAVEMVGRRAAVHQLQGNVLVLFLSAMLILCLVGADLLSPLPTWETSGPMLLFLGLLTLINAPFDWASLGLTRALLRRGLELGGWWPYLLALADGCLAAVIIAFLALTMVIGVQTFEELAVHGGSNKAVALSLVPLFNGIATNPGAPEYWWVYALLLSTMIPSLVNLAIGGMALTRGIPGLPRLLLLWTPEGRDVPEYKRPLVAGGLTLQMFAGAFFGLAAQAVLAWGLIFHVMPWAGLDLLDLARAVAAFDVPKHVWQLFAGTA